MRENAVRTIVGWLIIVGHLAVIAIVLIVLPAKLDREHIITILLTLGPVATAYFAAVVKSFIRTRRSFAPGRPVNMNFAVVAILLPTVFIGFLAWIVSTYPSGLAGDVQSLQQWIAGLEMALGGTVGFLVAEVFPETKGKEAAA